MGQGQGRNLRNLKPKNLTTVGIIFPRTRIWGQFAGVFRVELREAGGHCKLTRKITKSSFYSLNAWGRVSKSEGKS